MASSKQKVARPVVDIFIDCGSGRNVYDTGLFTAWLKFLEVALIAVGVTVLLLISLVRRRLIQK
jgi:hypothetical protein